MFFGMAMLLTMLIRFVYNKLVKFLRHVIWMKRKAHGTLVTDAEAAYWLKLIERPDYKPIWRWYYAEEWKKKHAPGVKAEKKKRTLARKVAYVNIVLVAVVAAFFLLAMVNVGNWSPFEFPTTTHISVENQYNATRTYTGSDKTFFDVWRGPVPYVAFEISFSRTDGLFGARSVYFNVIVHNFTTYGANNTPVKKFYASSARYLFADGSITNIFYIGDRDADNLYLGLPMNIRAKGVISFLLVLYLDPGYDVYGSAQKEMVTMKSTNGDMTISLFSPFYYSGRPGF